MFGNLEGNIQAQGELTGEMLLPRGIFFADSVDERSLAHLPDWASVTIPCHHSTRILKTMLFDPYVVMFVYKEDPKEADHIYPFLLVVDLRDNSVQETTISDISFSFEESGHAELYTLTKYGENQILRYGVTGRYASPFSLLTIESFQPLTVKCESFDVEGIPEKAHHTAQIHKDFLYVLGGYDQKDKTKETWRFDIKNCKWEELNPAGEGPANLRGTKTFLYEDNLYIYGLRSGDKNMFSLNLESMSWTKVAQKMTDPQHLQWKDLDQSIYQGTNSLRTLPIKSIGTGYSNIGHVLVNKNQMIAFENISNLRISFLNLNDIGLKPEETEEEKRFKSLFMNQEKSDVTIKVQDKLIPAHKEVLIKRSKYFEGLFTSGMRESRENVIEIQDCDSDLFQQLLRFLYTREVQLNEDLAMKLTVLSDKYVQTDLSEKCIGFLKSSVKSDNACKILDFACERDIELLKNFCSNFLKSNMKVKNLSSLIQALEKLPEIKANIISFILNSFDKVYEKYSKNWQFYEDFLLNNVDMSTISLFANFIYWEHSEMRQTSNMFEECRIGMFEESKDLIMQKTLGLKQSCLTFAQKNFKEIREKKISSVLPNHFLADVALYAISKV